MRSYLRGIRILVSLTPLVVAFLRDRKRWIIMGAPARRSERHHRRRAEKLVTRVAKLGPTFIKLGQLMSARADIFPEPYLTAIGTLQDQVPPNPTDEIIAVIEERCLASEGWLQRAIDAMSAGNYGAAGGPIADSDFKRIRDWVVYFCEYNDSIPPVIEGDTYQLNGANAVYRRELLLDHADLLSDGYWEATLHPALVAEGVKFLSVPEMAVRKRGPFSYGYYLRQRYLFSRAFAGARAENMSALKRAVYLLATPLVPGLVLFRIGSRLWAKRYRLGRFAMALPLILPALIVLAVGETVGYLLGPGDALSKVE